MADDLGDLVAVGRIGPPRGVRGDVFVEPWTDSPQERFAAGERLLTEPDTAGPLVIESANLAGGKVVIHFADVADRADAERLRGVRLFVRADERPPIDDPDEYYDTDLVGLEARTPDGSSLGPVTDVVHAGGASSLLVVVAGQERLVPFVSAIVPTVDIAGGFVVVDAPDGLFEL